MMTDVTTVHRALLLDIKYSCNRKHLHYDYALWGGWVTNNVVEIVY